MEPTRGYSVGLTAITRLVPSATGLPGHSLAKSGAPVNHSNTKTASTAQASYSGKKRPMLPDFAAFIEEG
jgi:hypothetical protein